MLLELIERAKNNDNDAMLELINRFDRVIRKYARLLKYEDAYEDVVMEFIAFIRKFQIENVVIPFSKPWWSRPRRESAAESAGGQKRGG